MYTFLSSQNEIKLGSECTFLAASLPVCQPLNYHISLSFEKTP